LGEILKQLRLLLCCHADAAVRHRKFDPGAPVRHLAHPQGNLALFRELTGIAQQIEQNLLEPHGVRSKRADVLLGLPDHETHDVPLALLAVYSRDELTLRQTQTTSLGWILKVLYRTEPRAKVVIHVSEITHLKPMATSLYAF
jgi:hypothetical protein